MGTHVFIPFCLKNEFFFVVVLVRGFFLFVAAFVANRNECRIYDEHLQIKQSNKKKERLNES